jgi:hypothetical protein
MGTTYWLKKIIFLIPVGGVVDLRHELLDDDDGDAVADLKGINVLKSLKSG